MPHGICAGQGRESGAQINLAEYHRAKTGALFIKGGQVVMDKAGAMDQPQCGGGGIRQVGPVIGAGPGGIAAAIGQIGRAHV